jgi:hypothetical protein
MKTAEEGQIGANSMLKSDGSLWWQDAISKNRFFDKEEKTSRSNCEDCWTMVSFTPIAVALLGLASCNSVAAFAPKKSGGFAIASSLKQVRILYLSSFVAVCCPSVRCQLEESGLDETGILGLGVLYRDYRNVQCCCLGTLSSLTAWKPLWFTCAGMPYLIGFQDLTLSCSFPSFVLVRL